MIWLHHIHGPMWQMTLPKPLAAAGVFIEEKIGPRLYRNQPIVTLSRSSEEEMLELGFPARNLSVITPGVDPAFTPGGPKNPRPLAMAVGRLVPVKDFRRLVRIWALVIDKVPDAELVIVGEGYERPDIEAEIARLGIGDSVRLPGRITDAELLDLYRRSWVATSASVREGWGMTLTEAAACGTPAVATDIAGHADAVAAGTLGTAGRLRRRSRCSPGVGARPTPTGGPNSKPGRSIGPRSSPGSTRHWRTSRCSRPTHVAGTGPGDTRGVDERGVRVRGRPRRRVRGLQRRVPDRRGVPPGNRGVRAHHRGLLELLGVGTRPRRVHRAPPPGGARGLACS